MTLETTSMVYAKGLMALRRHAASRTAFGDGMIAASFLAVGPPDEARLHKLLQQYVSYTSHYGRENPFRYPWPISTLGEAGDETYDIGAHGAWWRPLEDALRAKHPRAYARRLALAPVLATQLELWSRVAHSDSAQAHLAAQLLAQAGPKVEDDVAQAIGAIDPWADTFLLWQLTDRSGPFDIARGLLFALAIRYGTIARRTEGIVHGIRHPFHATPLVSATAHLVMGLWRFGLYPTLLPDQLTYLRISARDGAWADGTQPPDILTTLAAAEVMTRFHPDFDADATLRFVESRQEPDGWWRALDPEVPWLTAAVLDWIRRAAQPFAERFEWPSVAQWQRDYITGLPTMAFFSGVADALERIGHSLASAPVEAAFCDLAGFRAFNTKHGQAQGDAALRVFGQALSETGHLVVRIGGDEILVLSRPTESGALEASLRAFLDRWPDTLSQQLPVEPGAVRPRIIMGRGTAGTLRALHASLGEAIGELKKITPEIHGEGVLIWR